MKPAPFTYHRAYDVSEAVSLLTELGAEAKVLAGGQSLLAMMNFRLATPSALVDVNRVSALDYIRLDKGGLRIGALTRHRTIELAAGRLAAGGYALLPAAARWVGHLPIRTRGTFGGSIAHADPAAEWCIVATLLDALVRVSGPAGSRSVPVSEFFRGFLSTSLEPDELITEIAFPQPWRHAAITEYSRRAGDFAIVVAGAALELDGNRCTAARIVLGGVDAVPLRVTAAEAVLAGSSVGADLLTEAADVAAREVSPPDDAHGSRAYRRHLTRSLLIRALGEAQHAAA